MRPAPSTFLLFVTFLILIPVAAQPPQRDPQAMAILTQCLNAGGGAQTLAAIQDFTALGAITYSWAGQQVEGSVIVRGRGPGQFRLDAALPGGRPVVSKLHLDFSGWHATRVSHNHQSSH